MFGLIGWANGHGNQAPKPAESAQFKPGQVWKYKTRANEELSRVMIGKVEHDDHIGKIVHVKIIGLKLKNKRATDGFSEVLGHAPISEKALADSVTELTAEAAELKDFQRGYETWLASFKSGHAGVFTISLAEIAKFMEKALDR